MVRQGARICLFVYFLPSRCKELDFRGSILRSGFWKTNHPCNSGLEQDVSQWVLPDSRLWPKGARGAYFSVCALCAGKHEPRVRQVITQVHVGPSAQNPASFLQGDIRFYGNSIGTNDGSAGTSLTLDFSTLSVSGKARTDSPQRGKVRKQPWGIWGWKAWRGQDTDPPYLIAHLAKELLESLPQLP